MIMGVDIGTTSTKALVFDLKGNIISESKAGYPTMRPHPSYSEQDIDVIFQAVLDCIKTVNLQGRSKKHSLVGISFSCAMHSVMAVDKYCNPLTNSIIWSDNRSADIANSIKTSKNGPRIYKRTGTPIHPMSPLAKIAWIKANQPEVFAKTHKFISIKEYIFFKLFGEYLIDYSIASATGLFDSSTLDWLPEALSAAGISSAHLSTPVATSHVLKTLKPTYATYLELPTDLPFIIGASDGCVANLGANAIAPGEMAMTLGTSGAVRVTTEQPMPDVEQRLFSYILDIDTFVVGGPVNSGAIVFEWFMEQFGASPDDRKALTEDYDYDYFNALAQVIPAGSDGLIFLPYLMGERAPHWQAEARGVFFNIDIQHSKGHFARAVIEGIIFNLYSVGLALEETTGPVKIIYANGGAAQSPFWLQLISDVFNKPVVVQDNVESTALGTAFLGMKALGFATTLAQVSDWVTFGKRYEPRAKEHQIYQNNFAIFKRIYLKLKDEF